MRVRVRAVQSVCTEVVDTVNAFTSTYSFLNVCRPRGCGDPGVGGREHVVVPRVTRPTWRCSRPPGRAPIAVVGGKRRLGPVSGRQGGLGRGAGVRGASGRARWALGGLRVSRSDRWNVFG